MTTDWPDWTVSLENVQELSRYVDPESEVMPIGAHLRGSWHNADEGRSRAEELCRRLFERRINHAADPFGGTQSGTGMTSRVQRVRTAAEVHAGVGTCLDVSLLFAGMAMAADLRPLLGVTFDTNPAHALVVLDLDRPLSDMEEGEGPGGWRQETDVWLPEAGAQDGDGEDWWRHLDGERWLIVDVDELTRRETGFGDRREDFQTAMRKAYRTDLWGAEWAASWRLVDVAAVQRAKGRYVPRGGSVHYPIHMRLDDLPEFHDYPSREALSSPDLLREGGILVLHGPGGRGKSTLARRLAWQADNGCGWFLNATDAPTLKASLARAELAERGEHQEVGERAERLDPTEIEQLARDALDRLSASELPWVVVLDNCDLDPRDSALAPVVPHPGHPRQLVIATTRDDRWLTLEGILPPIEVPALQPRDLARLGLPEELAAVAPDPLIVEPLTVLHREGSATGTDPTAQHMIWRMVREALEDHPEAVQLARLLAWAPPDPLYVTDALLPVGAAKLLADLRFVDTSSVANDVREGQQRTGLIRLHRLFAEAIRDQTWSDEPAIAAQTIHTVLTGDWGRRVLLDASDQTALRCLEQGEAERAATFLTDSGAAGQIWYGLGHIRERRGPVRDSGPYFEKALERLDPLQWPYEYAEALVGQGRIAYQSRNSTKLELEETQNRVHQARELLAQAPGVNALQLREQANALHWLIRRTLLTRAKGDRLVEDLAEVLGELELSLERRLRLAGRPVDQPLDPPYPTFADGLGPERAYYNLAGTYVQLAKARFERTAGAPDNDVTSALDAAEVIYRRVADLRRRRYRSRFHPHHAACVHGRAIVEYHRMAMLGQVDHVLEACRQVTAGLEARWEVASWTPGITPERVARDGDVGKSFELLGKISIAALSVAGGSSSRRIREPIAHLAEALGELAGWQAWR
jgi:tetratricopeptide (TPR) repeat protein